MITQLILHDFHQRLGAHFTSFSGAEAVADYGDATQEHTSLRQTAGVLDLSFRGRLCLTGADRARFLHGQVTNDIKKLAPNSGCYAALVTAKGRMESDLNIYRLDEELLLDFEPGLSERISQRLERFIVADDVQAVDAAPHYGLLSIQGPQAAKLLSNLNLFGELPPILFAVRKAANPAGEVYVMNQPRLGSAGYDLFVPSAALEEIAARLGSAAESMGGRPCGWQAFELARIEAGIPRFGADMDETNLPLECGIEARAISYSKGCYVGQEVINRIHAIGHVNKELRGLKLAENLAALPEKRDKLFQAGKAVGYITSATWSPALQANIALGYVRREANAPGTELELRMASGESRAHVVDLPFRL